MNIVTQGIGGGRKTLKSGVDVVKARKYVADKVASIIADGGKPNLKSIKIEAGYSDSYAHSGELQSNSSFRGDFENKLNRYGVSRESMVQGLKSLITAKKKKVMYFSLSFPDRDIIEFVESADGHNVHSLEKTKSRKRLVYYMPDWCTIARGLDMLHKINGDYNHNKQKTFHQPMSTYRGF